MKKQVREYEAEGIVVQYDVGRCIHAAECVRGMPQVFNPNRRPWIDPAQADADQIAQVVARCPTGALHFTRTDGGPSEPTPTDTTFTLMPNGPIYAQGNLEITSPDGTVLLSDTRVGLCRCGASRNKPFCDGSHSASGFSAE